jgi:hypothetical protein
MAKYEYSLWRYPTTHPTPEDIMRNAKLGTCLAAAAITLAGSTYLAKPVAATELARPCNAEELAYANGYVDGYCAASGMGDGTVTSCESDGNGNLSGTATCSAA